MLRQTFACITLAVFLCFGAPCVFAQIISIDEYAIPSVYDNAEDLFGQTFLAQSADFLGVSLYIQDPTRPDNPAVNELVGPADLVLYDASNLTNPIEIGRGQVVSPAASAAGAVTFLLNAPVPTEVGKRYFFAINTADRYGVGLQSQLSSEYEGGNQAFLISGALTEESHGRDLSFRVFTSVPGPSALLIGLTGSVPGAFALLRHRRNLKRKEKTSTG